MAEKLKIIPLGGLNEIGKNMTAYEYGGEIIVVDCGMAFPGDDMYGIDCVIPDVSYLVKNKSRLRGLFITHGHEDHIGAIPYVLKQINLPIYCTRFTAGLIRLKLQEHRLLDSTKLVTVEAGQTVKAGKFQVEFIHVNHSIADSVAFAIHTRMGTVVHTGDFKIDSTPIDGEVIGARRPTQGAVFDRRVRPSQREEKSHLAHPDFPLLKALEERKKRLIEERRWADRNDQVDAATVEWMRALGFEVGQPRESGPKL